jgi:hypothetical protein
MFLLPTSLLSAPPNNDRSQNTLPFPSLYSLVLSWNLPVQKSINITKAYNILETIKEFLYSYFLAIGRMVYMYP